MREVLQMLQADEEDEDAEYKDDPDYLAFRTAMGNTL